MTLFNVKYAILGHVRGKGLRSVKALTLIHILATFIDVINDEMNVCLFAN